MSNECPKYDFKNFVEIRMVREPGESKKIMSSEEAFQVFRSLGMEDAAEEYFNMICLDAKGAIAGIHQVAHGFVSGAPIHPREVFKRALLNNATSIIVAHNHPSGDAEPSVDDLKTTKSLVEAGKILGIKVLDHLIIGDCRFTSLREKGLM